MPYNHSEDKGYQENTLLPDEWTSRMTTGRSLVQRGVGVDMGTKGTFMERFFTGILGGLILGGPGLGAIGYCLNRLDHENDWAGYVLRERPQMYSELRSASDNRNGARSR